MDHSNCSHSGHGEAVAGDDGRYNRNEFIVDVWIAHRPMGLCDTWGGERVSVIWLCVEA